MDKIKELDTVALLRDIPSKKLYRGDVGTVVTDLSGTVAELEFVDEKGKATYIGALKKTNLIKLRLEAIPA
mgnify:FL=1